MFTRRWVVDLVLDLAGYTPDKDLANGRVLEPSVGHGAFATAIAERLLASCREHGREIADCGGALRGFDVDASAVNATRANVSSSLIAAGVAPDVATGLVERWFQEADFLLAPAIEGVAYDWVVGNPPYIRVEDVKAETLQAYRAAWPTMSGRADVYVGFFEAGLAQLADGGRLAFICADRWMRNQYGAAIRERIVKEFAVDACVVMHTVDAFENSVSAYPAVVTIRRGEQGTAFVAETSSGFGARDAEDLLSDWVEGSNRSGGTFESSWTPGWFEDARSWPAGRPAALTQVRQFEQALPTLEEAGVRIAVGTATGADAVFVTASTEGIEEERLVRAVFAKDVSTGQVAWSGRWLVNPWRENKLVNLADFPGAAKYWRKHQARLKARYVAKKSPTTWWRTIDRVGQGTASTPKLLVPDLKDRIFPVLDEGHYQPMHSLYYLTSDEWDLEVLGGLLLSDIANSFVEAYSVRMASGYMRVSAQYLRRVRVPSYASIPQELRDALRTAFEARDVAAAEAAAQAAYVAAIERDRDSGPQEHVPSAV